MSIQQTSINLNSSNQQFKYVIEYTPLNDEYSRDSICWSDVNDVINIYKKSKIFIPYTPTTLDLKKVDFTKPYTGDVKLTDVSNHIISRYLGKIKLFEFDSDLWMMFDEDTQEMLGLLRRRGNEWLINPQDEVKDDPLPDIIRTGKIRLYFPTYSIDTYQTGVKYILSVNTWVNGKLVYLGNYVISRLNAVAAPNIKHIGENDYYECVDIEIVNPRDIVYGNMWSQFREEVCGKKLDINEGANLYISLTPVMKSDDGEKYIKLKEYSGGQNFINISPNSNDYLNLSIKYSHGIKDKVVANISINDEYKGDIKQYMKDNYNINFDNVKTELVILDETDGYRIIPPSQIKLDWSEFIFPRADEYDEAKESEILCFKDWSGYHEGMYMMASATFTSDGEDFVTIFSNKIVLTKELFKYLVGSKKIYNISLDNMTIYNINAVNKIEQKIIQMDKPSDSKSNIIAPIFFRSQPVNNIIVHPEVIENISINLDSYKSLVDTFMIQIEGISFNEIGRTNNGVIFKIIGKSLPNQQREGTYFITDTNGNMVTSGKYKYSE